MEHTVWAEKYRPKTIDECVLPAYVKSLAQKILETGEVPNLLLIGSSGVGKTTLAKAICITLGLDYKVINASIGGSESGIDALRNDIMRFASTQSMLSDQRKVIIFDEADHLSMNVQPALRAFMEEYSKLCGFIFTCNYPQKIIDAIHSRCTKIDFDALLQDEKKSLMTLTYTKISEILTLEGVSFDKKVLVNVVKENFPDIRQMLNLLQGYAQAYNEINTGILAVYRDTSLDEIVNIVREKKWNSVCDWAFSQTNLKPEIYGKLFKALKPLVVDRSKPSLVIILNDHQSKATHVADKSLNLLSALTEVMGNCDFN